MNLKKIFLLTIVCLLIGIMFSGNAPAVDTGVDITKVSTPSPIETTTQDIDVTIENNWPSDAEGYIAILLKDGGEYIRSSNGYLQNFAWFETKFVVPGGDTITRTVSCTFSSMEGKEGSCTMEVQFVDNTGTAWDTYTKTVEIAEEDDSSACSGVILIAGILGIVVGLAIVVRKKA